MCMGKYIECSKVVETKPKRRMTRRQSEVMALREKLPGLTDAQRRWMMSKPWDEDPHGLFWQRGKVWCLECGGVSYHGYFTLADATVGYKCPHCGRIIRLNRYESSYRGQREERRDCTVITHIDGYTVLRTFEVNRMNILNEPMQMSVHEIYQNWVDDNGKETILGIQYGRSMWSMRWHYDSEWSPKTHNGCSYTGAPDVFTPYGNYEYPVQRVSKKLRRNGWSREACSMCHIDPVILMRELLTSQTAEWLVKTGQYEMLSYLSRYGSVEDVAILHSVLLGAVKICVRNGYYITDASMYADYISLLEYFGKDTHNAFYVCPEDLKAAHDRLMKKKQRIEAKKELEQRIREAARHEKSYKKHRGLWFGVCFGNDDIVVTVIRSVAEMAEEGTMMHHCVYENEYWNVKKHPHSLILSARDRDGNRLETVEVSMKTWSIVQSRGLLNNPSERHDEIVALVNENMNKLKIA